MLELNKVLLAGNLVREPEARTIGEGTTVCELRLAISRQFTDRQGNERDEVCYVDVDTFRGCAESCQKYLHKASPVLVEGRLKMDQWDDRETGKKMSKLKIIADNVHFLSTGEGRRNGSGQSPNGNGNGCEPRAGNGAGGGGQVANAPYRPNRSAAPRAA